MPKTSRRLTAHPLTPGMRRIRLSGFPRPVFNSPGFDDDIRLMFRHLFVEVVEVVDDAHRLELRALPHIEVTWSVRDGAGAGTTSLLRDAVRNTNRWEGRPFARVAGERTAVRGLRRRLVEDREVPDEDVEFTGYRRRVEVVVLVPDEAVPDPEKPITPFGKLHEPVELICRGVTSAADPAGRTGSDDRALGQLLRPLHAVGILTETEPGHYGLTAVGEVLTNEFVSDTAHPAERLAKSPSAPAVSIAEFEVLAGVRHLVIHSGGAGAQEREFTAVHEVLHVTICALPAHRDRAIRLRVIRLRVRPGLRRRVHQSRPQSPTRRRRRPRTARSSREPPAGLPGAADRGRPRHRRPARARRRSGPARHHRARLLAPVGTH